MSKSSRPNKTDVNHSAGICRQKRITDNKPKKKRKADGTLRFCY